MHRFGRAPAMLADSRRVAGSQPAMEQLSPLDAGFLDAEDQDRHLSMAIASIAVFEGPAPAYDEFSSAVEARLPLVPRYRRKLRTVPFRLGAPLWVDDPNFDLSFHIRETALPAPGGDAELGRLMARVMANRLDRDHPLWEYWLMRSLEGGRWTLISKVHHSMVDGISGTDLYSVVFDLSPDSALRVGGAVPLEPEPSALSLLALSVRDAVLLPLRDIRATLAGLPQPAQIARRAALTARGLRRFAVALVPARGSSLTGSIGQQRRHSWARVSLDDVKTVKGVLGGTVNDVALAAVASSYRALLVRRGEHPSAHTIPSLVLVSVRAPGDESIRDNRLSATVANLPVHLEDPVERYQAVRDELSGLKRAGEAVAGETLVSLARYVPIAYGLRTGVSIMSYCGTMTYGITADYDTVADVDVLARGIEAGVTELLQAAGFPKQAPRRRRKETP